ncbi:unnamed protein product, partial [Ectocarpus sp. 13 AM-2016]
RAAVSLSKRSDRDFVSGEPDQMKAPLPIHCKDFNTAISPSGRRQHSLKRVCIVVVVSATCLQILSKEEGAVKIGSPSRVTQSHKEGRGAKKLTKGFDPATIDSDFRASRKITCSANDEQRIKGPPAQDCQRSPVQGATTEKNKPPANSVSEVSC